MSFFREIDIVKINIINNVFWLQPTILTFSRRRYTARPYKNFFKMLKVEELLERNFMFTCNGDNDLEIFRASQTIKNLKFFFNKENKTQMEAKGFIEYKIPGSNIIQKWDQRAINLLFKGFIPYFSIKWLKSKFIGKGKIYIYWTKKGFKNIEQ